MKILKKSGKTGKIRKPDKIPERKVILSYLMCNLSILWRNIVQTTEIWKYVENPEKSGKKSGKWINFRKRKLLYHIWEVNHLWRNVVKTTEIWRFEKNPKFLQKKKKKKEIFRLRSFAHKVKRKLKGLILEDTSKIKTKDDTSALSWKFQTSGTGAEKFWNILALSITPPKNLPGGRETDKQSAPSRLSFIERKPSASPKIWKT